MAGLGSVAPGPGAHVHHSAMPVLIATIFCIGGVLLPIHELRSGLAALHVHLTLQSFSLVLIPGAYWLLVYRWRWEVHSGILTAPFAAGTMAAMCMPTTTSTSLVFCQQARGDLSIAIVNMVGGSILGSLVSPLMAALLLGSSGAPDVDAASSTLKLCGEVLLPFFGGVIIQGCLTRVQPHPWAGARGSKVRKGLKITSNAALLFIFYLIFADAFGSPNGVSADHIAALVGWIVTLHLCIIIVAWLACRRLSPRRRIASYRHLNTGP